jgi:type IV pilus assembly protein PilV
MLMRRPLRRNVHGAIMLEALITMVIAAFGLLGLAALQARSFGLEAEAYQRAQALELVQAMVERINANRKNAITYVTQAALGDGPSLEDCSAKNAGRDRDWCEWGNQLRGVMEQSSSGKLLGGSASARGCIANPAPNRYVVSVAWQGNVRTKSPASDCARNEFGADDAWRRVISMSLDIASLK